MTLPLAKYIGDNFSVVAQVSNNGLLDSSFDATVWRGNAGTPYAGQIYVSMRGTQEAADFVADGDLATSGLAHAQLVDMVNWWLRETTPSTQMAKQIAISTTVISGVTLQNFVAAPDVQGTGTLAGIGAIKSVNGHSLGGYLASAFVRLFGNQQPPMEINTFNSAGFSRPAELNIENGFNQITQVIGTGLGLGGFSSAQNNYFAENGINVTTNTWNPVGFNQYGVRIGLFQEDLTSAIIDNHYMYKLTDLLALGDALARLDPTLDFAKLSALVSAGSNQMVASYESVLDAFRRLFLGPSVTSTPIGDANAGNTGPQPAARIQSNANVEALRQSPLFQQSSGLLAITLLANTSRDTLVTEAQRTDATGLAYRYALKELNRFAVLGAGYSGFNASGELDLFDPATGTGNLTDLYLQDRAAFLIWKNKTYTEDTDVGRLYDGSAWRYKDEASGAELWVGNPYDVKSTSALRHLVFGGSGTDALTGGDHGDHLYGGAGNDVLTAGAGEDYLEGQLGDDKLKGEDGRDILLGGQGNDTLDGGKGADRLEGGKGTDVYVLSSSAPANDVIRDMDGLGSLQLDGTPLDGGRWKAAGQWQDDARGITYSFNPDNSGRGNLVITCGAGIITVENFAVGELGLNLPGAPAALPSSPADQVMQGDLAPIDFDPNTAGVQIHLDQLGNVIVDPGVAEDNRVDTLYDGTGNDKLLGVGGNDILHADRGGNDTIDGGVGDDLVTAGPGDDVVVGFQGNDLILGGWGDDRVYALSESTVDAALVAGESGVGSQQRGEWLDGRTAREVFLREAA